MTNSIYNCDVEMKHIFIVVLEFDKINTHIVYSRFQCSKLYITSTLCEFNSLTFSIFLLVLPLNTTASDMGWKNYLIKLFKANRVVFFVLFLGVRYFVFLETAYLCSRALKNLKMKNKTICLMRRRTLAFLV